MTEVADHGVDVDVSGALRLGVDHMGDRGRPEPAEPESEVERRAEHHHEVGSLLEQPAGAQERQLVVGRQQTSAHAVEEARHTEMHAAAAASSSQAPSQ